jgi:phosphopantothenoylcysteine decarboxylase/phosphopantothenate--cysteine ligase
MSDLASRRILLGVSGSIAAIRAADLVRELTRGGAEVRVVMTEAATRLVTPALFANLSGNEVLTDLFAPSLLKVPHITLAQQAEAMAVVPATAATLARMAAGLAEDPVSALYLAMPPSRVLAAPAMNPRMWAHPATARSVVRLAGDGVTIVRPVAGEVACGPPGEGRLAPLPDILLALDRLLSLERPLAGHRVLVTTGATREPLDAVRFISNPSTGAMGLAMALEAHRLGAEVRVIAGAGVPEPPAPIICRRAETVATMGEALDAWFPWCSILVMAAAVGDYRSERVVAGKRKKGERWSIDLVPTRDLLASIAPSKGERLVLGFAAETTDLVESEGHRKLREKGMDLVVANDITGPESGFAAVTNRAILIDRDGGVVRLPLLEKGEVARAAFSRLAEAFLSES